MSHDHDHDHDELALRAAALEAVLVEKGLLSTDQIDAIVERYERDLGPQNGARVVARAWVDPAYRERLLADGAAAIGELGYGGFEGDTMVVVENTPDVHNVVVCTLCSCYPWPVLGLPPTWYKSPAYRARVVAEPRAVLREFGLELPSEKEIRVWDSTSEVRYLVLPERPAGTEGMGEEQARGARHARQHDRHRSSVPAGVSGVDPDLASPEAPAAPPRANGELVFEEPWESRAFGIAVALHDAGVVDFEAFRARLIAEIGAWEGSHPPEDDGYRYYERWLAALERTLLSERIVDRAALEAAREAIAHDWQHDHRH